MANPAQAHPEARTEARQLLVRGVPGRAAGGSRPDAVAAMRLARRTFQAAGKIDMQTLATELGVDRTTLYRWVGNREVLLGDVLWSVGAPTWRNALDAMTLDGPAGVAEAMGWFVKALIDSAPLRTFLRAEPERALRLLTTKASVVQREMVASVEVLLKQEQDRGNLTHPLPLHDLAYLIVRLAESFIYNDVITGERPDADKARTAIAFLLGAPPVAAVVQAPGAETPTKRRRSPSTNRRKAAP